MNPKETEEERGETVMDSFNKLQDSVKKLEQLINEPIHTYGPERNNN